MDSNSKDSGPEWASKNQALIVWKRDRPLGQFDPKEIRLIEPHASYRDPETEVPISGEDLFKKLIDSEKGWRCLGIYLLTESNDGVPCQKLTAVVARFTMLAH